MKHERILNAFKNQKAFIGFLTGGDPSIEKTEEFILKMVEGGADLIEIGIPFSDPIAEGPVIQEANIRALRVGCDVDQLFALVSRLRLRTHIPIVFLTYLNPVFVYGYDNFFAQCSQSGVDGIIIPDLPFEEQNEVRSVSDRQGIALISLISPTSEERIQQIAKSATGFLYVVSSMGVTGVRSEIKTDLSGMIAAAKSVTDIPIAVGFGIHTPEQAAAVAQVADGVIVGSAIVKLIGQHGEKAADAVCNYTKQMKQAMLSGKENQYGENQ